MNRIAASYDFWVALERHWKEMFQFFAALPAIAATDEQARWWPDKPGGTPVRHAAPLITVIEAARAQRDIMALRALALLGLSMLKPTVQQQETAAWGLVQDLVKNNWILAPGGYIVGRRVAP